MDPFKHLLTIVIISIIAIGCLPKTKKPTSDSKVESSFFTDGWPKALYQDDPFNDLVNFALGSLKITDPNKSYYMLMGTSSVVHDSLFRVLRLPQEKYQLVPYRRSVYLEADDCINREKLISESFKPEATATEIVFIRHMFEGYIMTNTLKFYQPYIASINPKAKVYGRFTSKNWGLLESVKNKFEASGDLTLDASTSIVIGEEKNEELSEGLMINNQSAKARSFFQVEFVDVMEACKNTDPILIVEKENSRYQELDLKIKEFLAKNYNWQGQSYASDWFRFLEVESAFKDKHPADNQGL